MAKKATRNRKAKQARIKMIRNTNEQLVKMIQDRTADIVHLRASARLLVDQAYPTLRGADVVELDGMIRSQLAMVPCSACPPGDNGQRVAIPAGDPWYANPSEWPPICAECKAKADAEAAAKGQ